MAKRKRKPRTTVISALRYRSEEQRDLIRRAAEKLDTSMNSFIRAAAEKAAREQLGLLQGGSTDGQS